MVVPKVFLTGVVLGLFVAGMANGQTTTTTIFFEGTGGENGVTENGVTDFSYRASTWTGGFVGTQGVLGLYASGRFSYHAEAAGGMVTFSTPMDSVKFFYVHNDSFPEGTATAFAGDGTELGSVMTNLAGFFGGGHTRFEAFDFDDPIARIEFSGGVIDDFSYTTPRGVQLFRFPVAGTQEEPVVTTTATGIGEVIVDSLAGTVTVHVTHDVIDVTASHIHGPAVRGQNAGIIFGLGEPASPIDTVWADPTSEEIQLILDGMTYVNVHSVANGPGELRGQIVDELGAPLGLFGCPAGGPPMVYDGYALFGILGDVLVLGLSVGALLALSRRRRMSAAS